LRSKERRNHCFCLWIELSRCTWLRQVCRHVMMCKQNIHVQTERTNVQFAPERGAGSEASATQPPHAEHLWWRRGRCWSTPTFRSNGDGCYQLHQAGGCKITEDRTRRQKHQMGCFRRARVGRQCALGGSRRAPQQSVAWQAESHSSPRLAPARARYRSKPRQQVGHSACLREGS